MTAQTAHDGSFSHMSPIWNFPPCPLWANAPSCAVRRGMSSRRFLFVRSKNSGTIGGRRCPLISLIFLIVRCNLGLGFGHHLDTAVVAPDREVGLAPRVLAAL